MLSGLPRGAQPFRSNQLISKKIYWAKAPTGNIMEFAEFTIPLFERLDKGEFILLFSSVIQDELESAPKNVRDL